MTSHNRSRKLAAELDSGPLFSWIGPTASTVRTVPDGPDGFGGISNDSADRPDLGGSGRSTVRTVRTVPDGPPEILNDSADRPDRGFHPLRGGNIRTVAPPPHPQSLLADGPGVGVGPGPRSAADQGSDQTSEAPEWKLNAPLPQKGSPTLRPYQLESLAGIAREHEAGNRSTLLVLATGLGKTVVFASWSRMRVDAGRRVLVLAHRTELLTQALAKLEAVGVHAAIEQAERRAGNAQVVVASIQTLRGKRLAALDPNEFDVVIDEAHHTTAASYRAVLAHFSRSLILGVTATADRGDGTALGEVFDSVAYRFEIREGIAGGYLAPIRARQIHVEGVDLSSVRSRAGDLAPDELAAIMATEQAVIGVVDPLLREVGTRRTIAFCVDVAHSMAIAEAINRYQPGAARVGHGELAPEERAEILADFAAGKFQFLVNCQLWVEGFDEPSISCVATIRPTKSRAMVVQQVGRGTRLLGLTIEESRANGKADLLWLDFTGNAGRHKLVGPIDALAAGEVDDDVRKEADRILADEDMGVDEALDEAARRLEERRRAAKITASARYFAADIDPFFGAEMGPPCLEPWAGDRATAEQHEILLGIGLKKLPNTLTRGEAVRIIAANQERHRLKLASYKQVRLLQRAGINAKRMSKSQAGARIDVLVRCDYDPVRARPALQRIEADEIVRQSKEASR